MLYYTDIRMKIEQLKREIYEGKIPTWYGCQEIDRLEKLIYNTNLKKDRDGIK